MMYNTTGLFRCRHDFKDTAYILLQGMLRSQFCWTILYLILLSLVVLLRPAGELWTDLDLKTTVSLSADMIKQGVLN